MEHVKERRNFIIGFGLTAAALSAGLGSAVSGAMRRLFSWLLEGDSFQAGKPEDYQAGKVDGRWKEKHGVWIVRNLDGIFALSAFSAFGCTPAWIENEQKFHCSCHKKDYYKSGISFEGASGKSLERVKISLENGEILVQPGKRFLLQDGGWQRPFSILPV